MSPFFDMSPVFDKTQEAPNCSESVYSISIQKSSNLTQAPEVSIIIPAFNAQETLEFTISSLIAQSFKNWEAIIVDNNSTDRTFSIARELQLKDSRIRVTIENNQGVSFARNTGIAISSASWLLFLDSDDWLDKNALNEFSIHANFHNDVDAVYCKSVRVAKDGKNIPLHYTNSSGKLFHVFAENCGFPIHSCLVKKDLVLKAKCFDVAIQFGEDWDLWQKLARIGTKFKPINKTLAYYRLRKGSAILDQDSFYQQHEIIKRARTSDIRLENVDPEFKDGISTENLADNALELLACCAALNIGQKNDPTKLIDELSCYKYHKINCHTLAVAFYDLIPCALQSSQEIWLEIYKEYLPLIINFLTKLESTLGLAGIALNTIKLLDMYIINNSTTSKIELETSNLIKLELSDPIEDIILKSESRTVNIAMYYMSEYVAQITLPLVEGVLPSEVIKEQIAKKNYWEILTIYFEKKVTPEVEIKIQANSCSYFYNDRLISSKPCSDKSISDAEADLFEAIWWSYIIETLKLEPTIFSEKNDQVRWIENKDFEIEIGEVINSVSSDHEILNANIYYNQNFIQQIKLKLKDKYLHSNLIKQEIIECIKDELPKLFVLNYLLGHKDTKLIAKQTKKQRFIKINGATETTLLSTKLNSAIINSANISGQKIDYDYQAEDSYIIFDSDKSNTPTRIFREQEKPQLNNSSNTHRIYDREHFEQTFSTSEDPWNYESEYEKLKYEQTLSILPNNKFGKVLELACAEGRFTQMLTKYADELHAADISSVAISRAKTRNSNTTKFKQLDFTKDELGQNYDLIICSEALYSCASLETLDHVINNIYQSVKPDGYFVTANAVVYGEEPETPGFDWPCSLGSKTISDACSKKFRLVKELRCPFYRIHLFKKTSSNEEIIPVTEKINYITNDQINKQFISNTKLAYKKSRVEKLESDSVPVLLYHRITEQEESGFTVSVKNFEEQIKFLSDSGYNSISPRELFNSINNKTKIIGKPLLITFDDGYSDFYNLAYPILEKYNFSALVFLVSDYIGEKNLWDKNLLKCLSLMNWIEIKDLASRGIFFGSHTLSHRNLNTISNQEIIEQLYISRANLQDKLDALVDSIAYPYGCYNFESQFFTRALGYKLGFTTEQKRASIYNENLMAIPRIEIENTDSLSEFVKKISK